MIGFPRSACSAGLVKSRSGKGVGEQAGSDQAQSFPFGSVNYSVARYRPSLTAHPLLDQWQCQGLIVACLQ
jgi:hypothetical protein